MNRSSGLDFKDRGPMMVDPHPDVVLNPGNPNLQRNKSERNRLQGLMRITSNASNGAEGRFIPTSWKEKWDLWLINEGGRRLFFFSWIFLQILVFIFGWFNYALKDNEVTARATFGVTFGKQK